MGRFEFERPRGGDAAPGDRDLPWVLPAAFLGLAGLAFYATRMADRDWVENVYARRLFPPVRSILSRVASLFPVSLSELLAVVLGLGLLLLVGRNLRDVLVNQRSIQNVIGRGVVLGITVAAIGYIAFVGLWGLNHRRPALSHLLDLPIQEATAEELEQLLEVLAAEATEARADLEENVDGVAQLSTSRREVWERLTEAWNEAGRETSILAGSDPVVRVAMASPFLTAGNITGIYSPFTGESHINGGPLDITLPFVAAHEIAHARGFAREDEANYLAARVCRRSKDADLRYSGALSSLRYVHAALMRAGQHERMELDEGIQRDLAAIRAYWRKDRGAVARITGEVTEVANDTYLKSQGDERGTRSYGAMVNLLLAEWRGR